MFNLLAYFNVEVAMIALAAILVLFGGKKIPELMRGVGQGVGELKKGMEEGQRHLTSAIHEESKPIETPVVASTPTTPQ